jgi:hypothetical protein
MRTKTAAMVLGLSMMVTLVLVPSAAHADTMTKHRAGRYYEQTVCPVNPTIRHLNSLLPSHYAGLHGTRLHRLNKALRAQASANRTAARKLSNPPANWPGTVASKVKTLVFRMRSLARHERTLANSGWVGRRWGIYWNNQVLPRFVSISHASKRIRAALDLGRIC